MDRAQAITRPGGELVIAATKLHAPKRRTGSVARHELVATLIEGASAKLTLIDAPAGFGKTTLVADWRASPDNRLPFAWLSLDRQDNDPARFWAAAIAALRTVEPGLGAEAEAALRARGVELTELALPLLINELTELAGRLVLVLDDLHVVRDESVHRSLEFLLEHMPSTLHLAVTTRSDPPLPLGRLRARGEMTELRVADLRFSEAEAGALLAEALDFELDAGDVARLQERTEGWPAGLYLAALSLRGRADVAGFIASFAGDDRQIVDYLLSEVLAGQPDELRTFMLRTSVLERLSGPLCDAVTGSNGSRETLALIERSNLFLVPLDTTRSWYRYHNLFAELLRHELERSEGGDAVRALHRRACAWYREQGSVAEAIQHAAAAGDTEQLRELTVRHWNAAFNEGRLALVASWLDALPRELVAGDARLCVVAAWLAMDAGRLDEARERIAAAERALPGVAPGEAGSVESDTAALRAVHRFKVGELGEAEAAARRVLELEPDGDSFPRAVAHLILGVSLFWAERAGAAGAALERAGRLAEATGNQLGRSYALGYLALARLEQGEPDEADRLAALAIGLSDDPGFVEHFVPMVGHLALARLEERRGRLGDAEALARRALELSQRGAGRLEQAAALLALGQLRCLRGDRSEARELLRRARRALDGCADPGPLAGRVANAERALLALGAGRPAEPVEALTERELAVLRLLNSELSQREIGRALFVSLNTVKTHTRGVYRKLDASTREQAIARARELGVL